MKSDQVIRAVMRGHERSKLTRKRKGYLAGGVNKTKLSVLCISCTNGESGLDIFTIGA